MSGFYALTFTVTVALSPLLVVAVTVAVPFFRAVILPPETVATDVSEELHLTVLFVASAGATVAFTVVLWSTARFTVLFESVMDVAGTDTFTVKVAVRPLLVLAVMVAVPPPTAVILPFETVATDVSDELHLTVLFVASAGATVAFTVVL